MNYYEIDETKEKNEWVEWYGGGRPIPRKIKIEVKYETGETDISHSDDFRWTHDGCYDIHFYRIIY